MTLSSPHFFHSTKSRESRFVPNFFALAGAVRRDGACRGTWARVTIDHFRHSALQNCTGIGRVRAWGVYQLSVRRERRALEVDAVRGLVCVAEACAQTRAGCHSSLPSGVPIGILHINENASGRMAEGPRLSRPISFWMKATIASMWSVTRSQAAYV